MTFPRLARHSLRTRITLTTLIIFVTSMLALAYFASRTLHKDMERQLGERQFLAATFMAGDINGELNDRLKALENIAEGISPAVFGNPVALQALLEQRPILTPLFNGGAFVVRIDGTATASIPTSVGRVGVNYMERDYLVTVLKEGKSTIGKPIMGKKLHSPLIVMGTPIRDTQGHVIGALMGVIDLGRPNFLNRITNNTYGKTGGYLLVAPKYRLIVTASDRTRIFQTLSDVGVSAVTERHLVGYEGTDIYINPLGVEELASAKSVPVVGWYVLVTLPTSEAFASIRELQKRMLAATLFLTLLAGSLTWWLLRRQLLPMVEAAKALTVRAGTDQPPQPLPVTSNDEIGELIGGFNGLLKIVGDRETGLRESEARFRRAIEEAPFPIMIHANDGSVVDLSRVWTEITGYTLQDIPTIPDWTEKAYGEKKEDVRAYINTIYDSTQRNAEGEYRVRCSDGNERIWDFSSVGLGAMPDGRRMALSIAVDVTERKQAEGELELHRNHLEKLVAARTAQLVEANAAAEAANVAKNAFLANMSHELRTPMNGVMGMIDLVLMRATDPKQIAWLNKSKGAASHLLEVINDILDISKIESDRMTLEQKDFSLAQTIDNVISMLDAAALVKGLRLSREIDASLPDMFCGDVIRLKQILINFVGNAIKFSDQGQIMVRAHALENADTGVLLRVEVTDQGIGISPEQQKRLFQVFTQADESMTRKYGGTGLGLIISKRLALLMGGDAGVESTPAVGSTFWFTARLTAKEVRTVVAEPTANTSDATILKERYFAHRILVVDDEPINREEPQRLLEAVDLIIDTAEDGATAIAMARTESYAAIFMDMEMPKVNGLEATRQIRQLPGYRVIPIIAMTANASAEDKARYLEAGINNFLIKPFTPTELFATLLRALEREDF